MLDGDEVTQGSEERSQKVRLNGNILKLLLRFFKEYYTVQTDDDGVNKFKMVNWYTR
jgi:hypothetical protein